MVGHQLDEGPEAGGEYGPYYQSERFDIYKKYAQQLLDEGKAYYCFCTTEDLLHNVKNNALLSNRSAMHVPAAIFRQKRLKHVSLQANRILSVSRFLLKAPLPYMT